MPSLPDYQRPAYLPEKAKRVTTRDRFHNSPTWVRLRQKKLRESPLCEVHLACEQYIDCTERAPVDHIIPISYGGSKTALDNLMTLCNECHNRKSAMEMRGPLCDSDDTPAGKVPVYGGKAQVIKELAKSIL